MILWWTSLFWVFPVVWGGCRCHWVVLMSAMFLQTHLLIFLQFSVCSLILLQHVSSAWQLASGITCGIKYKMKSIEFYNCNPPRLGFATTSTVPGLVTYNTLRWGDSLPEHSYQFFGNWGDCGGQKSLDHLKNNPIQFQNINHLTHLSFLLLLVDHKV